MRNPFRSPRAFLSADDVASRLGVSAARARQMASEGKLPPPLPQSGRGSLWDSRDVEAVRAGERRTLRSSGVSVPMSALSRTCDRVMA
jgi:predicted DNA-binding transcriptional regulator AlpA